jgi:esterase/lipase
MVKKAMRVLLIVLAIVAIAFLAGPTVEVDTTIYPVSLPDDLDQYLADSEAQFPDIVPDTEKTIIWAGEPGQKTPLSIVYIHGFSATRQETAPLSDNLAAELGANLFYTRLTGHGRTGAAMAEASVNDWLNDTNEALEIGRQLGDKVIVIGTSTGATVATWLAKQPDIDDVLAFILISPNFAPKDSTSELLTIPWGEQIATAVIGPERSWEPKNEMHGRYWTYSYPTEAILPMMGLVKLARSDVDTITHPIQVIYSPNDQAINPERVETVYEQFSSSQKQIISISEPEDESNHVLAGDILAPGDTEPVAEMILSFIGTVK